MLETYYQLKPVRTAAILTNSYVASSKIGENAVNTTGVDKNNQLILYIDFTIGSLTSAEIKIEFSNDGTNWYQETVQAISSGTITMSVAERTFGATGAYRILTTTKDRYYRVSAIGTGTLTSSSMAISGIVGNT